MEENHIEEIDDLIYSYTGRSKTIISISTSHLNLPGENYCSLMLKVDVTLKNLVNDEEENLHVVAKCRRRLDTIVDSISSLQFKKEIDFYTEIVPVLQQFQRQQAVEEIYDIFPKIIAFRRNLHGKNDEIDDHAVILMENLKEKGTVL